MKQLEPFLTTPDVSIKDAWVQLSKNGYGAIFVTDGELHILGSVTDGDIRRWILKDNSILDKIIKVTNTEPFVAYEKDGVEHVKQTLIKARVECLPILNNESKVVRIVFWDEVFKKQENRFLGQISLPVVIMAGGLGTRLKPFSKIIPKPLFPIGEQPIIEVIIEKFFHYGINDFTISLGHKANMIKAYFADNNSNYQINFITENEPRGTAGSLSYLKKKFEKTIIVSNTDIIIDANYCDIIEFHCSNKNDITLVCSMKNFTLPYGVVEIHQGGELKSIREKPEHNYLVITGLYLLEPNLLELVPDAGKLEMPDFINMIKANNHKIGVYPISNEAWIDIGELKEYQKTVRDLEL